MTQKQTAQHQRAFDLRDDFADALIEAINEHTAFYVVADDDRPFMRNLAEALIRDGWVVEHPESEARAIGDLA